MKRRDFLKGVLACSAGIAPILSSAAVEKGDERWMEQFLQQPRSLRLVRASTGERIDSLYWHPDRGWVERGYYELCYLMRDTRAGEATGMSAALLDTLYLLQSWLKHYGHDEEFTLTSGYRTTRTNAKTEGAAKDSLHIQGRAADITSTQIPVITLALMASELKLGGVGYYGRKRFLHVDDGLYRIWMGKR